MIGRKRSARRTASFIVDLMLKRRLTCRRKRRCVPGTQHALVGTTHAYIPRTCPPPDAGTSLPCCALIEIQGQQAQHVHSIPCIRPTHSHINCGACCSRLDSLPIPISPHCFVQACTYDPGFSPNAVTCCLLFAFTLLFNRWRERRDKLALELLLLEGSSKSAAPVQCMDAFCTDWTACACVCRCALRTQYVHP